MLNASPFSRGASVDIQDGSGFTALEKAIYKLSGPLEILTEYYLVSGRVEEIEVAKAKYKKLSKKKRA